jgi:uncharacterized Zn finger protein
MEEIYICPSCGSINTKEMIGFRNYTPTTRKCIDCDYIGICPTVPKEKIKEFQKRMKKKNK